MDTRNERRVSAPFESANEARLAVPVGSARYVLAVSLGLAVIAGAIIWLAFFA